jgi:hypothetical protein
MSISGSCDSLVNPGGTVHCLVTQINNGPSDVNYAGMSLHIDAPNFVTGIFIPECPSEVTANLNPDGSWDAFCFPYELQSPGGFNSETLGWALAIDTSAEPGTEVDMEFGADAVDVDETNPGNELLPWTYEINEGGSNLAPTARIIINEDSGRGDEAEDVGVGDEVGLDGSKSTDRDKIFDEPQGISSYQWTLTTPPGSSVELTEEEKTMPMADFTPDVPGTYIIELVVTDEHDEPSPTETRTVQASGNVRPVANIVTLSSVELPESGEKITIELDGSGTDLDGTVVKYKWKLLENPPFSPPGIVSRFTEDTTYDTAVKGKYVFGLKVIDNSLLRQQ